MPINFEARIWLWENDPSDIDVWVYELEHDYLDGNAKYIKDELEKLDLRLRFYSRTLVTINLSVRVLRIVRSPI